MARYGYQGAYHDVVVFDLSEKGCRFHDPHGALRLEDQITIFLGSIGPFKATVRWRSQDSVGIEFDKPLYTPVLDHICAEFAVRPSRR